MDEDIKYLVYLFFVIIYIVSRAFKKKKGSRGPAPVSQSPTETKEAEVTFEDLLREFGADIPKKEAAPVPEPQPVNIPDDDYAMEVYRKSIVSAESQPTPRKAPLLKVEEEMSFERDDHYKILEKENLLAEKLKNPESLREAIIFNEILNRKYD